MKHLLQLFSVVLLMYFLAPHQSLIGQGGSSSNTQLQPVTQTYALTGVSIVQAPDKEPVKGTVLIKDGLIHAVGADVSIPGEAEVIDMESMYLYPGFIDGMSHTGIPKPKADQNQGNRSRRQGRSDAANPPNKDAGIQPERLVRDLIDPKDASIAALRKVGFTAVHVVPRGRMLPGSGALVMLSGDSPDEMILQGQSSLFGQFVTAPGVYPGTLLGIMAKWRDLYRQAKLAQQHEQAYTQNPTGMKRPNYDRVVTAFYPILNKDFPVVFKAEKALEAYRAIALSEELGYALVLAGLQQGWDLTDEIQSANIPVFLSLDLPKAEKEKKESDSEEVPKEMTELEKEAEALKERKAKAYTQTVSQAATFAKAGIDFGLSTEGSKVKSIQENLRTMIKHGLSEEDALAALTTHPANILGVSDIMGTVEAGKIANLVISDKPYFEEKSNVRYVFVEGNLFEFEAPKPKKKGDPDAAPAKAAGTWSYTVETPQGSFFRDLGNQWGSRLLHRDHFQ